MEINKKETAIAGGKIGPLNYIGPTTGPYICVWTKIVSQRASWRVVYIISSAQEMTMDAIFVFLSFREEESCFWTVKYYNNIRPLVFDSSVSHINWQVARERERGVGENFLNLKMGLVY